MEQAKINEDIWLVHICEILSCEKLRIIEIPEYVVFKAQLEVGDEA